MGGCILCFVPIRESPEIAAVVNRIGDAWAARDFETYANLISSGPHFRGIGTDVDEFSESAEKHLRVVRAQMDELTDQGWSRVDATVDRMDAFEDGPVGWASILLTVKTPVGDQPVRMTTVLVLESGAWKIVQWHTSVPTPYVQTHGVELTTTLDDLLSSVAQDSVALGTLATSEGTLTLVFTDIVDSTVMAERMGDAGWVELIGNHESDIRRIVTKHSGTVVKMLGDGSMLSFGSARAATRAALEIHEVTADLDYAIRIGIHSGEVTRQEGDLLGVTVNKTARIASIAQAGQILVSAVVAELVGPVDGLDFGPPETVTLKGLSGTHILMAIEPNSIAGRP
jgi:class 3 adenylate cyclase